MMLIKTYSLNIFIKIIPFVIKTTETHRTLGKFAQLDTPLQNIKPGWVEQVAHRTYTKGRGALILDKKRIAEDHRAS